MTGSELLDKIRERDDPVSLRDIPSPEVYTVRQVAGMLGLALGMTYDLVRRGEIPAKRLGRRWLVPRVAFHAWLTEVKAVAA